MKVAFILNDEVQFARFLAYAAEHELYVNPCILSKKAREGCGYAISWKNRTCIVEPIEILKARGYYITDNVHLQLADWGEYKLEVTIDYEYIQF